MRSARCTAIVSTRCATSCARACASDGSMCVLSARQLSPRTNASTSCATRGACLKRRHWQRDRRPVTDAAAREHRDAVLAAVVIQQARAERRVVLRVLLEDVDLIDAAGPVRAAIDLLQQYEVRIGCLDELRH